MKGTEEEKMASIEEYHLRTRCLQLSGNNDPVYGLISPYYAISHDQVPLELADSTGLTVHTTGCPYVYDAIGKDSDVKRFCTLNLFGAMWNREDGLNIPMPHLVLKAPFVLDQSGTTKRRSHFGMTELLFRFKRMLGLIQQLICLD